MDKFQWQQLDKIIVRESDTIFSKIPWAEISWVIISLSEHCDYWGRYTR